MFKFLKNYFSHYQGLNTNSLYVLLVIFVYSLGFATIVFLPIYLHADLQHSLLSTGFAISAYGVGTIIASYQGGKLCDRFSSRNVTIASLLLSSLILMSLYFIKGPYELLILLLVLLGMTNAAFLPASRIYLMRLTPPHDQARANGVRYMLYNIGCAGSLALAAAFIGVNYVKVFVLSAIFNVIALSFVWLLCKKEEFTPTTSKKLLGHLWNDKFLLSILVYYFVGMLVFVELNSVYTLYLFDHYGITTHHLGTLFALNCLLVAFFQVPIINYLKHYSQTFIMTVGIFLIGLGFFMLIFGRSYSLAVISMVVITIGEMMFMPISQNIIYQKAKEELKGYYMGLYQALYSITLIVSPFLGSMLLKINPNGQVLWTISLVICVLPLLAYLLFKKYHS